ncbi:hypothetical protein Moror_2906 [Moniliophthora roreri MCA 2997]|uniref:DUF6534 domain-containing protein n=1 Tax=Moniliophthora roreri (strain MCA 2997) TaxID=1381753 RepID=V2XEF5_MONRO|nr:hypothetical protein Moror_2906 [Moniliophthora roreri MCA 2997]
MPTYSPSALSTTSPLTDVPIFLGCVASALLLGAMIIQVFTYYIAFRQDNRYIKVTVWFVFFAECLSSVLAVTTSSVCLAKSRRLANETDAWLFQALSVLSGLVTVIVHCFYAWRIRVLGGNIIIVLAVAILTLIQCTAVIIAGNKVFLEANPPNIEPFIGLWLSGNIICDIVITGSLVALLRNAILILSNSREKTKVEKMMIVAVETGMITVLGALLKLIFFLAFRRKRSVHYALFYVLPKLYGNCMMTILNMRQVTVPRKTLLDSNGYRAEEAIQKFGHLSSKPERSFASTTTISTIASFKSSNIFEAQEGINRKGSFLASEKDITDSWDSVTCSERVSRFWYSYTIPTAPRMDSVRNDSFVAPPEKVVLES